LRVSNMPDDTRSDEDLILAERQPASPVGGGETEALNTLFKRYLEPLRWFLLKHSWFKDDTHLDDLIQEILKIAFIRIKSGKFQSEGAGSFRRYLYKIASIECKKQDIARAGQPIPLSSRFPLVETGVADDVASSATGRRGTELVALPTATPSLDLFQDDRRYKKLIKALKTLSGEEIRLLILVNRKIPYKEIITYPMFSQYKLDSLKQKVYDIRQKVERINQEVKDEE